jgi:hypothetical protein
MFTEVRSKKEMFTEIDRHRGPSTQDNKQTAGLLFCNTQNFRLSATH